MEPEVHEKIGVLSAKVDAAHNRVDKVEGSIKDTLVEIKGDLKDLNTYMNKAKGYTAAIVLVASMGGAGLTKLIAWIFTAAAAAK